MRRALLAIAILTMATVSSQGMIVITTDDPVDLSLAKTLAAASGATVVVVEKGIYDELLVQRMVSLKPEGIIIMGGGNGIIPQLETSLKKHGFQTKRITGLSDREKSLSLLREFRGIFAAKAVVSLGRDALKNAMPYAVSKKYPLLIVDNKELKSLLSQLKEMGIREYVLFSANRQGDLKEEIRKRIDSAKDIVEGAQGKMEYLRRKGVDIKKFEEHLKTCRATLDVAMRAYEEGDLLRALQFFDEALSCLQELDNDLNEVTKNIG